MAMIKNRFNQNKSHEYTKEMIEELFKCTQDIVHFASKYITIVHPDPNIGKHIIKLRDYQNTFLNLLVNEDRVVVMSSRQSAKTCTICIYLYWFAIFNPNVTIAILAHKDSCAMSILNDIKIMHDDLPSWIKPNYIEYNAHTLSFDNGSKIFCAATSRDALVGESITICYFDELGLVEDADEFFAYNSATVTEGKQIIISSTPRGVGNLFHKIWSESSQGRSRYKHMRIDWWQVPGRDEKWKEDTIKEIGPVRFASEYGNSFIGSQSTVLSATALQKLVSVDPISEEKLLRGVIKTWEEYNPAYQYISSIDLGLGTGADYSVMHIYRLEYRKPNIDDIAEYQNKDLDLPEIIITKLYQVLKFKSNVDNLTDFGSTCIDILKEWGNPYGIFEHNGIGMTLSERLMHGDLEYENMYVHDNGKIGIMSGPLMKIKMIEYLKKYMEDDKVVVRDQDTISELMTYVEKQSTSGNKKFEADTGCDDETVCVGWTCYLLSTTWLIDMMTYK